MVDQHSNERPADRLPPMTKPSLVTVHDLTPEQREHVEIYRPGQALKWRWKDGYQLVDGGPRGG